MSLNSDLGKIVAGTTLSENSRDGVDQIMGMFRSNGFTLIELMIVVAIVGIIAATSVSIYRDYVPKTQVSRAVAELGAYKSAFDERVSRSGSVTNSDIGYTPSDITTGDSAADIASINADGSGHMEVTMGGNAHPAVAATVIRWERLGSGIWQCVIDKTSAGSWVESFEPPNCEII